VTARHRPTPGCTRGGEVYLSRQCWSHPADQNPAGPAVEIGTPRLRIARSLAQGIPSTFGRLSAPIIR
jgi:hypothetical protein